jgi:hypothetical protein
MPLIGALVALLVATSGLGFFSVPVADNDLWGHVGFGRQILQSGRIPATNLYSYTAPHHPWINHELLAECLFAALFDRFGAPGLLVLKTSVGFAMLGVLARAARRRGSHPLAVACALVLVASLTAYGFLVRPQIFTFLFLAILWERLLAWHETAAAAGMRWLPALFALWVNTHGGVLAGVGVLLAFAAPSVAEGGLRKARPLVAVSLASLGALLANPWGLDLPAFLLRDVLRERPITEWAAISLFDLSNARFEAAVVLAAAGGLFLRPRNFPELLLIALAAAAALRHERHVPLFAILAAPHLARTLEASGRRLARAVRLPGLSRGATALLGAGLSAIALVQVYAVVRLHWDLRFGIFVSPEVFPVRAVRFLRENELSGNLAVSFGWGEYAIWHLYPRCRVSVDGRYTTAYPDEVLEQAWRFMEGDPAGDGILREASLALVERRHGAGWRLLRSDAWLPIYEDDTALVFARREVALPEPLRRPPPIHPAVAFFP